MKNTMSKTEYILTQLWYSLLAIIYFRSTCFTLVFGLNNDLSCTVYWIVVIIVTIWGYRMTYRNKRNGFSVFVNAVLPNGIYLIISYAKYFTPLYWTVCVLGCCLVVCFALLVFSAKARPDIDIYKLLKNRFRLFSHGARSIAAVCMVILIVNIGANALFGNPMYKTTIKSSASVSDSEQWTVEKQIDIVHKLEPDIWKELSRAEKQDILGVIRNIEIRYLGLNHPVELGFTVLETNTLGSYRDNLQQILIDLNHLDEAPAEEVLHTLLHEMYHVYQYEQVKVLEYIPEEYQKLLMFSKPIEYAEEFANYTDGDKDYFFYKMQTLEVMANSYAESGIKQYYELIDKYMKGVSDDV